MTPQFARAVDPVIVHVLELLDRIGRQAAGSVREERDQVLQKVRDAEAQLGSSEGWPWAKYALAAWIDEVLVAAPWPERKEWANNTLEFDFFKTQDRATDFFLKAKEADKLPTSDVSEVYYVCVLLGFRGLYGSDPNEALFLADRFHLPHSIEEWTRSMSRRIKLLQTAEVPHSVAEIEGAPPLTGKFMLVGAVLLLILMSSVFAIVFKFWIYPQLGLMASP